ncbi:MAG: MalY/PatB family protein [Acidimicrobiales bacterium]
MDELLATIRQRRALSKKWHRYAHDIAPAWVADMDLPLAPCIQEAIIRATQDSDLGYSSDALQARYVDALNAWTERNYSTSYPVEEIQVISDVVQGIALSLQSQLQPGDPLLVLTPSYPPFFQVARELSLKLITSELLMREGRYEVDFNDLERAMTAARGGALLLCQPHNPTGRVFTRVELQEITSLALRNDMIIVSDEIHRDLCYEPYQHLPVRTISDDVAAKTITLLSASKTFNIAGLAAAALHTPTGMRIGRGNVVSPMLLAHPSIMGLLGGAVAFEEGAAWLESTKKTLSYNRELIRSWSLTRPEIEYATPEATYLAWFKVRALNTTDSLWTYLYRKARVALGDGQDYLPGSNEYVRLNFATETTLLERVLEQLTQALDEPESST